MRGSPLTVVAKLAAVGAIGAWRYNRKRKAERRDRIEAEYEVLGPERIAPVARPSPEPRTRPEGTGLRVDDDLSASP
jgi:hypothetical protein